MNYMMELRKYVGSRPLIMVGVTVIVRNEDGHILLQKRTDSIDWGVLGGAKELGESLEETASRELYEEAGLSAKHFKFITNLSGEKFYYQYPNGHEVYNVTAVYEAIDIQGEPTIKDDEGLALMYFSLEQPIAQINPNTYMILKEAGYITKW